MFCSHQEEAIASCVIPVDEHMHMHQTRCALYFCGTCKLMTGMLGPLSLRIDKTSPDMSI